MSITDDGLDLEQARSIRELNDRFRMTMIGGRVVMTAGIAAMAPRLITAAVQHVRGFAAFGPDNDPHHEHDCGSFDLAGDRIMWKIDYYDLTMDFGSENPADPSQTTRVLTIMLASEY